MFLDIKRNQGGEEEGERRRGEGGRRKDGEGGVNLRIARKSVQTIYMLRGLLYSKDRGSEEMA